VQSVDEIFLAGLLGLSMDGPAAYLCGVRPPRICQGPTMKPPILKRLTITDSRGVSWAVVYSGPTMSGSIRPGEDITQLPETYFVRFKHPGGGVITLDLSTDDATPDELKRLLEEAPEWQYEDWD
jgi:hypothetical protein